MIVITTTFSRHVLLLLLFASSFFHKWGSSALAVSTAVPFPFPTSVFFEAAGASEYSVGRLRASSTWRLFLRPLSGENEPRGEPVILSRAELREA